MSFDVFGHEEVLGKNVVIIGGGLVGCELSIHLAGLGRTVKVVEMGEFMAANAELTERMAILVEMEKCNVESWTNATCTEIFDTGIMISTSEGQSLLSADSVIVCVGTKPLLEERDQFIATAFDVINVGDCVRASNIANATETGWNAGAIL